MTGERVKLGRRGQTHHDRMARVARIDHRIAELTAERAQIFADIANDASGLEDGRRLPANHEPELPEVSEIDRARAQAALREVGRRRRLRP